MQVRFTFDIEKKNLLAEFKVISTAWPADDQLLQPNHKDNWRQKL